MNTIREWAYMLCMTALAAALVQYILPGGAMERVIRLVLGGFVVCALIMPFKKALPALSIELEALEQAPAQDAGRLTGTVNAQMEKAAASGIRGLVAEELMGMGIKCENIAVMMDTNELGSISISKVVVSLGPEFAVRAGEVQLRLEERLGLKTEVSTGEG